MATNDAWMTAEVAGPKKASIITKPEVADAIIKRAKRPIMIVGHIAAEIDLEDEKLIDFLIELAKKADIPIVATAHVNQEFLKRGYKPAGLMSAVDIGNRLCDPEWKGLDTKATYDLAIFAGLPYPLAWTILSGLKHFAPTVKTMTLDNVYHPHASWSFSNISIKDWIVNLKGIIENLEV